MKRLLIIEDDEWTRLVMQIILKEVKLDFQIEGNGLEALNYLRNVNPKMFPQVIFVDIKMPVMDGYSFIDSYEKEFLKSFPQTKLIVLSNSEPELEKMKEKKFKSVNEYITKPLTTQKITSLISN